MKSLFRPRPALAAISSSFLAFLPSLAAAHPGHYHPPGEDDEFDTFSAALQSLPGWQSLLLASLLLGAIVVTLRRKNTTPAL